MTTPLRLSRLVRRKKVDLQAVQYLVLDEADKLLELKSDPHTVSHVHQVDRIMGACSHPDLVRALLPSEALCNGSHWHLLILRKAITAHLTTMSLINSGSLCYQAVLLQWSFSGLLVCERLMANCRHNAARIT